MEENDINNWCDECDMGPTDECLCRPEGPTQEDEDMGRHNWTSLMWEKCRP